jgi:hypothetical protein
LKTAATFNDKHHLTIRQEMRYFAIDEAQFVHFSSVDVRDFLHGISPGITPSFARGALSGAQSDGRRAFVLGVFGSSL